MVAITNIVLGTLAASAAYASPLSASCKAYQGQLTTIVQEIPQAQNFCSSWLASKQKTSPIKGVPGAILTQACKCATQDTASARVLATTPRGPGAIAGAAAASICKNVQLAKILSGLKNVQYFCSTFDPSQWTSRSPILGATSQSVQQACKCFLAASTATSIPAPSATPAGPPVPFHFCPSNTMQIAPFKAFCNTALWKSWACSCSTVAQVCFPKQPLTWCPRPSTSAPVSSSTSTVAQSSTTAISTPPVFTPTSAPTTSVTTTEVPVASSSSTTDAPVVSSSTTLVPVVSPTTTDAPAASTTTVGEPIVASSTTEAPLASSASSTEDSSVTPTSSDNSVPT